MEAAQAAVDTGDAAEVLRFPVSMSGFRVDVDKKGEACHVLDVVLNPDVIKQAQAFRQAPTSAMHVISPSVQRADADACMRPAASMTCHLMRQLAAGTPASCTQLQKSLQQHSRTARHALQVLETAEPMAAACVPCLAGR